MSDHGVIIIGGGFIGACCADALTASGLKVTLLERHFPASGSSRACDGLILLWDKTPGPEMALGKASVTLWEEIVPELDTRVEYRKTGTLLVSETEDSLVRDLEMVADLASRGIRASALNPIELQELEPALAPDLAGGAYFPDDYQVDPRQATLAVMRKAQRQGLTLRNGEQVLDLRRASGESAAWEIRTQRMTYTSDRVVCAAGVWSTEIMGKVGVDLPVRPRKGHILVIKSAADRLRHPVLEGGYEATVHAGSDELQVALVAEMTPSGTILVGSSRQFAGFNTQVSWDVLSALAARATRFFPELANAPLIRSYAGLRPWSPDHLPLIGPVDGLEGLYLATGHEGAGICLGPVTGQLIAQWITESEPPPLGEALTPGRLLN